jgi:hypothetical protein
LREAETEEDIERSEESKENNMFEWDFFVPSIKILCFFYLFDWDFFVSLLFGISLDTFII